MWIKNVINRFHQKNIKAPCYNLGFTKSYSVIASILGHPNIGDETEVKGWVKNLRAMKGIVFADITDGSCAEKLQIVIPKNLKTDALTYGSSVHVTGKLARTPKGQLELQAEKLKVVGECVVLDGYPFNPRTTHSLEYVRQFLHLRSRTNYMAAVLRIRHAVTRHIHEFFHSKNYLHINTPILTSNDCEGAGEVFKLQPDNERTVKAMMQDGKDFDSAYFGTKTFLTVSGQLHLEAVCRGMGNVYTLGPTFRAENSRSRLHLSEFYMLEAELAFCENLQQLQDVIEELLKYIFVQTRNTNDSDLFIIDKDNLAPSWLDKKFVTMTYDDAKSVLKNKQVSLIEESLNKEQELALVEYCGGVPVFVVQWPKELKSFYMKECEHCDDKVEALDLLTPITGEIVGGSLREDDYKKLKLKLPSDQLNWYLELRKFGNVPTAGFGLGLERLMQVLCRINNIKDTLPFPRWPHNCDM